MSDTKEYISNITLPNGETKYVKDSELTTTVSTLQNTVKTNESNISTLTKNLNTEISERKNVTSDLQAKLDNTNINVTNNTNTIKVNQQNILTNSTAIGENRANITTNKTNISTNAKSIESINSTLSKMIDTIYPVGSIYLSMTTANPQTLFGVGTWERIKDRFLLGCGDSYDTIGITGGEETHTLTVEEMPSHNHTSSQYNAYCNNYGDKYTTATGSGMWFNPNNIVTDKTGGGKAHNNMPPYVTCYMWKRVS